MTRLNENMQVETTDLTIVQGIAYLSASDLITYLKQNNSITSYSILFKGLENSNTIINEVIFRNAILCKQDNQIFDLSNKVAQRKADNIALNRRKKFVRRTWKKTPLFAISLIRKRYKDYTEDLLIKDLTINKKNRKKEKFKRRPSSFGLRISQIQKLSSSLKFSDLTESERNTICNKIAGFANGLKLKKPICLTVRYNGETLEYKFLWNETEFKIKSFVALTKTCSSFEELDKSWNDRLSCGD